LVAVNLLESLGLQKWNKTDENKLLSQFQNKKIENKCKAFILENQLLIHNVLVKHYKAATLNTLANASSYFKAKKDLQDFNYNLIENQGKDQSLLDVQLERKFLKPAEKETKKTVTETKNKLDQAIEIETNALKNFLHVNIDTLFLLEQLSGADYYDLKSIKIAILIIQRLEKQNKMFDSTRIPMENERMLAFLSKIKPVLTKASQESQVDNLTVVSIKRFLRSLKSMNASALIIIEVERLVELFEPKKEETKTNKEKGPEDYIPHIPPGVIKKKKSENELSKEVEAAKNRLCSDELKLEDKRVTLINLVDIFKEHTNNSTLNNPVADTIQVLNDFLKLKELKPDAKRNKEEVDNLNAIQFAIQHMIKPFLLTWGLLQQPPK